MGENKRLISFRTSSVLRTDKHALINVLFDFMVTTKCYYKDGLLTRDKAFLNRGIFFGNKIKCLGLKMPCVWQITH